MKPYLVLACVFVLGLSACGKEDHTSELLLGRWELKEAFRQNRATATLNDLYFEFSRDTLYTNNVNLGIHPYEYANDTIRILSGEPYRFEVFSVDSSSLDLKGEIKQVPFYLKFEKVRP